MDFEEIFPSESNYLKAADLKGREWVLVIATVKGVTLNNKRKLVIEFQNAKKSLVCNKTNAKRIASIHGRDIDDWIGKEITLFPTEVDFQGDMVPAIRVKKAAIYEPEQEMPARPQPAPQKPAATSPAPGNAGKQALSRPDWKEELGDEVPF